MVARDVDWPALAQRGVHGLDGLHRRGVDDAGALGSSHERRAARCQLVVLAGHLDDAVVQVGPVDAGADDLEAIDAELAARCRRSPPASRSRSARGSSAGRGAAGRRPISRKAGRKSWPHCETQCASSTTSRLTGCADSAVEEVGVGEPLRRREHDPRAAFGDRLLGRGDARRRSIALFSWTAAIPSSRELVALVLHQRDQRRDDERDAGQQERGQLVAQRLARAGRHHRERRAARQHVRDDGFLALAQGPDPEGPAQRALDRCARSIQGAEFLMRVRRRDGRELRPPPRPGCGMRFG